MRQTTLQHYVGARKARIAAQIEAKERETKLLAEENKWADLRATEIAFFVKKFGILGEDDQIICGMFAEVGDASARPDDEDAINRLAALRKAGEPFCAKRKSKKKKTATATDIPQPAPLSASPPKGSAENDAQGGVPKASGGTVTAPPNDEVPLIDRPPADPAAPEGTAMDSIVSAPDGTPSSQDPLPASGTMTVAPAEALGHPLAGATIDDTDDATDPDGQSSVAAESTTQVSAEDVPQADVVLAVGEPVSPPPTGAPALIAACPPAPGTIPEVSATDTALPAPTEAPSAMVMLPASDTVTTEPTETLSDPLAVPTMADTGDAIDPGGQASVTTESAPRVLATANPGTPAPSAHGPTAAPQAAEILEGTPGATSLDPPSTATEHDPPVLDVASAGEPPAKRNALFKPSFGGGRGDGKGPPPKK